METPGTCYICIIYVVDLNISGGPDEVSSIMSVASIPCGVGLRFKVCGERRFQTYLQVSHSQHLVQTISTCACVWLGLALTMVGISPY